MIDTTFTAMGCEVRLIIGGARSAAARAALDARAWLAQYEQTLSRFDPRSELTRLNDDPHATVPASPLLRTAVSAGIWAAQRSGGLVDPTLASAIERAGYVDSWHAGCGADIRAALSTAPQPRPASPAAAAVWREIVVDNRLETVTRPPGLRIDSGGFGKGLAADALAHRLAEFDPVVVDCGGDIRVRAPRGHAIRIEDPLTRGVFAELELRDGAIATSGIARRIWRRGDGFAHHVLDPSTGEPAWTGLVQATALAPTALEAETLAKAALLAGPSHSCHLEGNYRPPGGTSADWLGRHGGITVAVDGAIATHGPLVERELEVAA